ncbi:MAG: YicC family protein [Deltaproteobacteria bacterium]|nr:YicC family protein [Deltaproteobacteria bacterium]
MLQSMTGYGRAEYTHGEIKAVTEVRSVNHRYLEMSLRMSRSLYGLEKNIRAEVSAAVARGKVDVSIQLERDGDRDLGLHLHTEQAARLAGLLRELGSATGCVQEPDMASLLAFKDLLFEQRETENDPDTSWNAIKPALSAALQAMRAMQTAEGEATVRDMRDRLATIQGHVEAIGAAAPALLRQRRDALREKIQNLCDGIMIDEGRLTQEIALMCDRSDITEELVRLTSHIKQFQQWLEAEGAIGRKLDFLMQEMNREINTIGSKISDSAVALQVVEVKNELEKIREQIQNIM